MDKKKLWKCLSYDGFHFSKDKHSVNMACNIVCFSNFIHIGLNLFYISIIWKYKMLTIFESKITAVWLQVQL